MFWNFVNYREFCYLNEDSMESFILKDCLIHPPDPIFHGH